MLKPSLIKNDDSPHRVLCLGAHCDDIEIGCGGTILRLLENYANLEFHWVVFSSNEERAREALVSANHFLGNERANAVSIRNFRDGFFPFIGEEIKECFEQLKNEFAPDLIFTHYRNDLHQDHRLISDLTWNTFRDHLILEYEIPKYDGDLGSPNFFVHLDESTCRRKIKHLTDAFGTQKAKSWFSGETFMAVLRLRGIESNSPTKYAEGFYCRKMVLF